MSADVVQSKCADNTTCTFAPGKCSILNISPLGYTANYICGYSDGTYTYMCNPGCCPGGVVPGFCPDTVQPDPLCTDQEYCDPLNADKPCRPHQLADGRYACGYVQSSRDPQTNKVVDLFYFCNPGCSSCKGTGAVGPCKGQSTTVQQVSYNNRRPVPNPWMALPADQVQIPMLNRYFYAVIVLLIALAIAGTLALV
jgi:hypothetical protein